MPNPVTNCPKSIVLAILLIMPSAAPSQKPTMQAPVSNPAGKPAPAQSRADETIDRMLAQALRKNPDVRVAEAKLQEAEAELTRVRLQVIKIVLAHHSNLAEQRAAVSSAELLFSRSKLPANQLASQKRLLANLEAESLYLMGKTGLIAAGDRLLTIGEATTVDSPMRPRLGPQSPPLSDEAVTRLLVALNQKIKVDYEATTLSSILEHMANTIGGISFQLAENLAPGSAPEKYAFKTTLRLNEEVPVGAALQLLADLKPGLIFVVRDYGILVTDADSVPAGAQTVRDFWMAHQAKK